MLLCLVALSGAVTPAAADPADQTCTFVFGFANLKARLGDWMGDPSTCEFADPNGTGDVHQVTTAGLAFWRKSTNTPTFTDGWHHWALTTRGFLTWTGESIDPSQAASVGQPHPCVAVRDCRPITPAFAEAQRPAVNPPASAQAAPPPSSPSEPAPTTPTPIWTQVSTVSPLRGEVVAAPDFPRTNKLFRVRSGQVQNSLDQGKTWFQVAPNVCGSSMVLSPTFSEDGMMVAGRGTSVLGVPCGISHNGGYTFDPLDLKAIFATSSSPESSSFVISPTHASDGRLYYAGDFNIFPRHRSVLRASSDSGQSWSDRPLPSNDLRFEGQDSIAVTGSASGRATLLVRLQDHQRDPPTRYFRSLDLGHSWDEITEQFRDQSSGRIPSLGLVAGKDPDNVFAVSATQLGGSGVWASSDAGATWRHVTAGRIVSATPDGCGISAGDSLELICGGQVATRTGAPQSRFGATSVWDVLAAGDFADHGTILVSAGQGLYLVQMRP
jgi:hypothetical protein